MAPLIPSAKATLSYPLYACDFDPLDSSRLVVGGGGGAGRSGVGNKITLIDTSKPDELAEIGEVDLSKNEDNVTSLAVGQRKGRATLVFAGVNSDLNAVAKGGKNSHFRVFGIEPPGKGKGKSPAKKSTVSTTHKITEISRSTLFSGTDKDTYQRITRLSKPFLNQPQLGAITTGLSKESELVLFETSAISPPNSRGSLKSNREVVDVDFIQSGKTEHLVVYCNEHEIYSKTLSSKSDEEEPDCIYIFPFSDSHEKPTVPKFRAIRFLTKDLLLALTNIANNGGVVLQIFRMPTKKGDQCRLAIGGSYRLPSNIRKATGLAVCNLTPPASPSEEQGYTQFIIAVAGHDISISLFKCDLQVEAKVSLPRPITPFRTFKQVHPLQITGITFSNFTPPSRPITAGTPPQYLKLASVGVSNTVVVHTLPLFPVPLSVKKGQSKTPRYVVALPSESVKLAMGILLTILVAALVAILVQGVLEIRGAVQPWLNATNYIPNTLQEAIGKPYVFPKDYIKQATGEGYGYNHHLGVPADSPLESLIAEAGDSEGVVVIKDAGEGSGGLEAGVHEEVPMGGKTWDELGQKQREGWKKKLTDAGHWAEGMGETILKGVVFGELGGAIGQAVGGG